MSAKPKVKVEVIHPANPLAPPPNANPAATPRDIDNILCKLPEFRSGEPDAKSASSSGTGTRRQARGREAGAKPPARSVQERVRNLSASEQQKIARTGELPMRVALERVYGKAVWDALLRNSRLTPPEVLRIARMASLPVPLLELIVSNRGWLSNPQVRRALLSNRRLTKELIATVLRATPKAELKLMHRQTAYPPMVREAANKLVK